MGEFVSEILQKISSYNIFNYLFPGILFAAFSTIFSSYNFTHDNLIIALVVYYFIGLVISRIGSLIVEPLLLKTGFAKFEDYGAFIQACRSDEKIETLSEANNMYRTLIALVIAILALAGFEKLSKSFPVIGSWGPYIGLFSLLIMFLFAYRKQTSYITKRINAAGEDS